MEMVKKEAKGNTLDSDIIEHHILPRLPAKSLFRFKGVCKRWLSLISDNPIFVRQHSQSLKASSSGLIYYGNEGSLIFLSTDQTPIGVPDPTLSFIGCSNPDVLSSCGGLLCGLKSSYSQKTIWVCNPVTKEITYIPVPEKLHEIGLAFDPSISGAPYHLVCPYRITPYGCTYGFHVFSSDTHVWRESKQKILVPRYWLMSQKSVFLAGVLYLKVGHDAVIWFQPKKDLAGITPLPYRNRSENCIGEWDGRFSSTLVADNELEIWVMTDFQWSKVYCVKLESIIVGNIDVFTSVCHTMNLRSRKASGNLIKQCKIKPLPFSGGDVLLLWVRRNIFSYNMKTREAVHVCVCEYFTADECFAYRNSLVPLPKQGNGL